MRRRAGVKQASQRWALLVLLAAASTAISARAAEGPTPAKPAVCNPQRDDAPVRSDRLSPDAIGRAAKKSAPQAPTFPAEKP
jgi:hypothetical protein